MILGCRVRAPAVGLPPQSFGRDKGFWMLVLVGAFVAGLLEGIGVFRWVFVLHGRLEPADFLFPPLMVIVVPSFEVIFPVTWVAGGDGWLMLLRRRQPGAWVRTSRLVHVSLKSTPDGEGGYDMDLTLRDDEGRELGTGLWKLTAKGAASLLRGIRQSSEAELADLSSLAAQAAVAALGELAQGRQPSPPQNLGD